MRCQVLLALRQSDRPASTIRIDSAGRFRSEILKTSSEGRNQLRNLVELETTRTAGDVAPLRGARRICMCLWHAKCSADTCPSRQQAAG